MSVFYYNLRNRRLERVADRNDDLMRKNAWQMDIKDRKVSLVNWDNSGRFLTYKNATGR